jgi:hypothetical protein
MNDGWIPFTQVTFEEDVSCFHIDTRDFCVSMNHYKPSGDIRGQKKIRNNPDEYYHTPEEMRNLIKRYFDESGGEAEWRMFSLSGIGYNRTCGWQLKYIRIFKFSKGLVIYDTQSKFIFSKTMLACPVHQKYLNTH